MVDISRDMVAVASGTPQQIARWCDSLSAAAIPYTVTEPCSGDDRSANRVELWIGSDHTDTARARIRAASSDDRSLLW